ncbi:MAG: hypothetical protein GX154_07715 [Clostridiales bacterium]|nr:hypothetical protein [Clostridiales bacterium]
MLSDTVKKYYSVDFGLNCAESVLYAANEEYGLGLDKSALKTMAAFGGGMGVEEACGAMTGSLAALGVIFVKDRAHESDKIKLLTKEFIRDFKEKLSTDNCRDLKEIFKNDKNKCEYIVVVAAQILDDIVRKEVGYRM